MLRYQNMKFTKKINLEILDDFFFKFPEEKRGRKKFLLKEIMNAKTILYDQVFKKAHKINADCLGSIIEKVIEKDVTITVSFFKKKNV